MFARFISEFKKKTLQWALKKALSQIKHLYMLPPNKRRILKSSLKTQWYYFYI